MSIYRARLRNTSNALSPQVSSKQIRLQVPPKLFPAFPPLSFIFPILLFSAFPAEKERHLHPQDTFLGSKFTKMRLRPRLGIFRTQETCMMVANGVLFPSNEI